MKRMWKMVFMWTALAMWGCTDEEEVDLHNPPPKSFRVLVFGEEMVAHGIPFSHGVDWVDFVDGWELSFDSALVTLANIQLSENPDMSSGDPSMTGEVVAELEGVFAIELKGGEGGDEGHRHEGDGDEGDGHGHEYALGVLSKQNKKKGSPAFDSKTRYAFGYSLVRATPEAQKIGFSEASAADYATMQEKGYSVFVRGKARFRGESCRQSEIEGSAASYDFSRLPDAFSFALGFEMPVAYKNCSNPQLGTDVRGVQVKDNASVDVTVALHFDHLFWEALEEDANLRLDAWAAQVISAPHELTNEQLAKVDFQAVRDAEGEAVPYRYCGNSRAGEKAEGVLTYSNGGVNAHPEGGAKGLRGLNDFIQYNLSTFGHLNGNGLCYPHREYPSP